VEPRRDVRVLDTRPSTVHGTAPPHVGPRDSRPEIIKAGNRSSQRRLGASLGRRSARAPRGFGFLLNPHGDVDGMIVTNRIEVHSPPHLSDEICAEIRPGDRVTVRGVRPRSADMIAAERRRDLIDSHLALATEN
jgi:hypothetical protein